MLRIPTPQLLPGMKLGRAVSHPHRAESILINSGVSMSASTIAHIAKFKIPSVWVSHPSFRMVDRFIRPGVIQACEDLRNHTGDLLQSLINKTGQDWMKKKAAETIIRRMIAEMNAAKEFPIYIYDPPPGDRSPLDNHAASTCYLTALLAMRVHSYIQRERRYASALPHQEIEHLGLGALLHDVGLRLISPEAYERWVETGDENDARWQLHVKEGYELARGCIDPVAAAVILHHHQYYDRSGFPSKLDWDGNVKSLGGGNVHVFARIGAVADQFDELKHQPNGRVWSTVRALKYFLMESTWNRLDPTVARTLFDVVPAFLPGTLVRLSSGDMGAVIDWKPGNPCRPTVALLNDLSILVADDDDVGDDTERENKPPAESEAVVEPESAQSDIANADSEPDDDLSPYPDQMGSMSRLGVRTINLARTAGLRIVEAEGEDVSGDHFSLPLNLRPATKAGGPYGDLEAA